MRFLADESCDFGVVQSHRTRGHDVKAISETAPRASDEEVADLALREERVLITEDKDFGQLVYAHGQKTVGVILLRFPAKARKRIAGELVQLVEEVGNSLIGSFAVVEPGRIRIVKLDAL
jgi:predicted nuclease of predicted toxin-antitoxin system